MGYTNRKFEKTNQHSSKEITTHYLLVQHEKAAHNWKISKDEYDNEMKQNNLITEIIGDFHINKTRCKQSTVNPSHKQVWSNFYCEVGQTTNLNKKYNLSSKLNLNIIENSRSATRTCIQKIKKWGPTGKPHLKQYDWECIAKKKQSPKQETVTNLLILLDSFHCPSRQALRVGRLVSRLSHCQFRRSIPQNMTCRSHLSLFLTCWSLKQESIQSLINIYSQL